jgi:hypothetical protein
MENGNDIHSFDVIIFVMRSGFSHLHCHQINVTRRTD